MLDGQRVRVLFLDEQPGILLLLAVISHAHQSVQASLAYAPAVQI